MKIKEKLSIMGVSIILIGTIVSPIKSNAALQANGTTGTKANFDNWLLNIRKMEETGGTLGLLDTINTTNLTSSAEQKNNIDIHMQKNTEYGAMAILSASAYGNQKKINAGETTTGNKTGVYMYLNNEWVAAGELSASTRFKNANEKYKNKYTLEYVAKKGDAIKETEGWHGSQDLTWLNADRSGVLRSHAGSIFSYYGYSYSGNFGYGYAANYENEWYSRAVIVVGNGY